LRSWHIDFFTFVYDFIADEQIESLIRITKIPAVRISRPPPSIHGLTIHAIAGKGLSVKPTTPSPVHVSPFQGDAPMKRFLVLFFGLFLAKAIYAQTLTITELYGFACPKSVCPEGAGPGPLIQASDGNFYGGTGIQGGIFKITAAGQLTVLHTFAEDPKTGHYDQGEGPSALVEASDGYLYGYNSSGGPDPDSSGTLFRLSKTGANFQVLQVFCTVCTTGSYPTNLTLGSDGNIYGTTSSGGIVNNMKICQGLGCGVVFRLTPPGTLTVLHEFNGTGDSSYPLSVILASDGNLYGTTNHYSYPGTLFRVNPITGQFKTVYSFTSTPVPIGGVVQLANGLLYGVAQPAKGLTGNPTIYSSTLSGKVETVATSPINVRNNYYSPILQATDGNLWTTAYYTTSNTLSVGAVLAFNPNGTLEHELFFNEAVGVAPWSGLLQTADGTLYGTAALGGSDSSGNPAYGTVYTIAGLPPK
jgi:uncharacterized repeat protein (TIGR03803 family)